MICIKLKWYFVQCVIFVKSCQVYKNDVYFSVLEFVNTEVFVTKRRKNPVVQNFLFRSLKERRALLEVRRKSMLVSFSREIHTVWRMQQEWGWRQIWEPHGALRLFNLRPLVTHTTIQRLLLMGTFINYLSTTTLIMLSTKFHTFFHLFSQSFTLVINRLFLLPYYSFTFTQCPILFSFEKWFLF